MMVAIASTDGKDLSLHFGRSPYFIVFRKVDGDVEQVEVRELKSALGRDHQQPDDGNRDGHSHSIFIELIGDCEAVLAGGMGHRAAVELAENGIKPFMVNRGLTPQQAAESYFAGELGDSEIFCECND